MKLYIHKHIDISQANLRNDQLRMCLNLTYLSIECTLRNGHHLLISTGPCNLMLHTVFAFPQLNTLGPEVERIEYSKGFMGGM
jgi:hypothetical protein